MENKLHTLNSKLIKETAHELGFFACGIAKAERVNTEAEEHFRQWLSKGGHADMAYMENYIDQRLDPRLLMEGAKSIVCVALNYAPLHSNHKSQASTLKPQTSNLKPQTLNIAAYALGQDYHDVVKQKLRQLFSKLEALAEGVKGRVFCDSAPLLERYWAEQSGLGWTGRNHQLIIPHAGTMFFLGELLLDVELDYDTPMPNRCGNCHRCIDACPTHALTTQTSNLNSQTSNLKPQTSNFNAEACLSYQTIENRGPIAPQYAKAMGNTIYGCDRCQQVCPWNRFAVPNTEPLLQPKPELLAMSRDDWEQLTIEDYRRLFKGSAVKRAKYEGLMRNIRAVSHSQEEEEE